MTATVEVRRRLGAFTLDAAFASGGRLTALFGPSGSGKTPLVNLIAGLGRPDAGRIAVDGRVLVDTAAGVFVPAHRRRIGYVFQDARLFPHLTVRQNLRYGRFFTPAADRYADVGRVVELPVREVVAEPEARRAPARDVLAVAGGRDRQRAERFEKPAFLVDVDEFLAMEEAGRHRRRVVEEGALHRLHVGACAGDDKRPANENPGAGPGFSRRLEAAHHFGSFPCTPST